MSADNKSLLTKHPLDCFMCDQAGECYLQDKINSFNSDIEIDKSFIKENIESPLIKTNMDRCIACGRCIRFCKEFAGTGNKLRDIVSSKISANLIDICPVGAITNKPIAFTYRTWELNKTEAIDVFDAVGSNVNIYSKGNKVIKVSPRSNKKINEIWISDKTRFAIDGLKNNRLDRCYIRDNNDVIIEASWDEALAKIAQEAKGKKIGAVIGDMVDCETIYILKELADEIECRQEGERYDVSHSIAYRFNSSFAGIDKADIILLIGTNPSTEAAVLDSRIYNNYYKRKTKIAVIGEKLDLEYKYDYLGEGKDALEELLEDNSEFGKLLSKAKYPMIILGTSSLVREDGYQIQSLVRDIANKYNAIRDDWNGFNMLHSQASRVGALKMGAISERTINDILKMNVVYLVGADEVDVKEISEKSFVIYQGSHGDKLASHADVILPSAAYTEKTATYVNMEGRAQRTNKVVNPVGQAKEGWQIVKDIAEVLGIELSYKDIDELRYELEESHVMFKNLGELISAKINNFGIDGNIQEKPLKSSINNFYMNDPISRASVTMVDVIKSKLGDDDA